MIRPINVQLARDVIAAMLHQATGLRVHVGDSNMPRPEIPYIGFSFPWGTPRRDSGGREVELTETIGVSTFTLSAAEGSPAKGRVGPATVSVVRQAEETLPELAARWAAEATWWLRDRGAAAAAGATVVVTPAAPGSVIRAEAIEGCTVAVVAGSSCGEVQRVLDASCRFEIFGTGSPHVSGAIGDGLDPIEIESRVREYFADPDQRRFFRGGWLTPKGGASPPAYSSVVSGVQRERRYSFQLSFGWTSHMVRAPRVVSSIELSLSGLAPTTEEPFTLEIEAEEEA